MCLVRGMWSVRCMCVCLGVVSCVELAFINYSDFLVHYLSIHVCTCISYCAFVLWMVCLTSHDGGIQGAGWELRPSLSHCGPPASERTVECARLVGQLIFWNPRHGSASMCTHLCCASTNSTIQCVVLACVAVSLCAHVLWFLLFPPN